MSLNGVLRRSGRRLSKTEGWECRLCGQGEIDWLDATQHLMAKHADELEPLGAAKLLKAVK